MPRFFKRLFKFPQMDFEMAVWEMTSLIIAPKKVFRSIYYHVSCSFPLTAIDYTNISYRNVWAAPVSLVHDEKVLTFNQQRPRIHGTDPILRLRTCYPSFFSSHLSLGV